MRQELMVYVDDELHPDQQNLEPHIRFDIQSKLRKAKLGEEYLVTFGSSMDGGTGITLPGIEWYPWLPFWFRPSRFVKSHRKEVFDEMLKIKEAETV
jgi:hypothetical protein